MTTLVSVGQAVLAPAAAAAYRRALQAGAPDSVTSSYRDPVRQMELYQGWVNRLVGYNFALHPDRSDHCKGVAIDLRGAAAKAWFRAWGRDYGWVFTDASEDWHIAYRMQYDRHLADVAPPNPITPTPPKEEDDMSPEQVAVLNEAAEHAYRARRNAEVTLDTVRRESIVEAFRSARAGSVEPTKAQVDEWIRHLTTEGSPYYDNIDAARLHIVASAKPAGSGVS